MGHRVYFAIVLFMLCVFFVLNIRLYWCSLCMDCERLVTFSLGHHGNSELKLLPKLWIKDELEALIKQNEKQFLYVTQTESCLSKEIFRPDQLGSSKTSYDVLVLSWKSPCVNTNEYDNVRYIYTTQNTSWSTGRNLLYSHILRHGVDKYLYYIFMDDDVMLYHTEPYQVYHERYKTFNTRLTVDVTSIYLQQRKTRQRRGDNSYREFEKFLLEFQPAVGLINFCFERREFCISQYIPDIWQAFCASQGTAPFPYVSYSNFDGAFNAFHRDAIIHLLPYHVTYEHVNWQESQKYLILDADIKFQGQVLYNLFIMGHGTKHRPYPRNIHWHANWPHILEELRKTIDKRYHNEIEVLPMEVTKRRFDVIRNPLPPHHPIQPYTHYNMNRTRTCHHRPNMYDIYNTFFESKAGKTTR